MNTTKAPHGIFVTGTDTGVGKTRVAAALCHALAAAGRRVAGMKPLASGCEFTPKGLRNEDAMALMAAMNVRASYAEVNPYAFEPPIAPHIAAREAGQPIEIEVLDRAFQRLRLRSDLVIVEGAGGWLVPLDDATATFADLAVHWRLPVILVIGLRLGCINHALLTVEAIERRGLPIYGWIGNSVDAQFSRCDDNVATLRQRIRAPCVGLLPHAPGASASAVSHQIDITALL